ncbi:MAG: UDP-N-acetylmuramate dehydrogenase [Rikenellaceae bacterium]
MIRIFNNITLRDRNSFHIDVKTARLIEFESPKDLHEIFTNYSIDSWMVLSGGNNILFTKDLELTLLTPTSTSINIVGQNDVSVTVRVDGGVEWDDVVEWSVERGLWGAENLSLIPGKTGAAPIQNIGAYGVEICDFLKSVEYFDPLTLQVKQIKAADCNFGYRDSIFKRELKGQVIVTAIEIVLSKVENPQLHYADLVQRVSQRGGATLRNIRDVICEIRNEKLPDTTKVGNAGSFFKNPIVSISELEELKLKYPNIPSYPIGADSSNVKLAAGWLIDQAGMKGYTKGEVGVHDRQALVLINIGHAKGDEVLALSREVQQRVNECFGVEIEAEVNIL